MNEHSNEIERRVKSVWQQAQQDGQIPVSSRDWPLWQHWTPDFEEESPGRPEVDLSLADLGGLASALQDSMHRFPQTAEWASEMHDRIMSLFHYWTDRIPAEKMDSITLQIKKKVQ